MVVRYVAGLVLALTSLAVGAQTTKLSPEAQKQALVQFQAFQQQLKNRNMDALYPSIERSAYIYGNMLGGEHGSKVCNDIDKPEQVTQKIVSQCKGNILDSLAGLSQVKVDPSKGRFLKTVTGSRQDVCKQIYTGRFNSGTKSDLERWGKTPGIVIEINSAQNTQFSGADSDDCERYELFYFSFINHKLKLASFQQFP